MNITQLAIGIILVAALLPVAFNQFFGADTTNWDAGTVALWALVPIFVILGVLVHYSRKSGGGGSA